MDFNRCLTLICLLFLGTRSFAQEHQPDLVTLDLRQTSLVDFLQQLEQKTSYRFYYDTADFDTTKIDIRADRQPFDRVLTQVFAGTGISYSIDRHRQVFIAKGEAIYTELPPDFFDKVAQDKGSLAAGDTIRDYLEEVGRQPVATLENKLFRDRG